MKRIKHFIYYLLALIIPIPDFLNILFVIFSFVYSFLQYHLINPTIIDTLITFVILGLVDSLIFGVENKF